MRPGFGIPRPNAAARRAGIHFALDLSHPEALPWIRGGVGAAAGGLYNGAIRDTTRRGWGLTGTNGYWRVTPNTATYSLPTTQGTILFHAVSATQSGDGAALRRYMWAFGDGAAWPANPWCGCADFDTEIAVGWVNGAGDSRIKVSSLAGAAWPANSSPLIGFSYGPGGQSVFSNGVLLGSNSFNTFGDTSVKWLAVGDGEIGIPWQRSVDDAILYLLVFDREFTPAEHARAAIDPWWWLDVSTRGAMRDAASVLPHTATPGPGQITLAGRQPLVQGAATMRPGAGQLAVSGAAPIVRAGATVRPGPGQLLWQGRAPVINPNPSLQRAVRLAARDRAAQLVARDRTVALPARNRTHRLQPERT